MLALTSCRQRTAATKNESAGPSASAPRQSATAHEAQLSALEQRARDVLGSAALPGYAESAELAESLAVAAARLGKGPQALDLARAAADVRARMWRAAHRDADLHDAVALYTNVARDALAQGLLDEGCIAAHRRALLAGEARGDPELMYRELYVVSRIFEKTRCEDACARDLRTLGAHRPPLATLAALDVEAARDRAKALTRRTEAKVGAPVVSADDGGVVVAPPPTSGPPARVKVVSIDPYGSKDRARVVITLSGPTTYRAGELPGRRLLLDLDHTEPSARREIGVIGLVEKVRQIQRPSASADAGGTRIVLDLGAPAHRRIFYLPEPFRIVVDLATHEPPRASSPPGAPRQVARVAIDAGHGGSDPGAIGPSGVREKDVTLAIAHLVAPILSNELGIVTMLTRDDDRLVPLDARAARANAFHADLFVSIHCNASENPGAHGVMSFVLDTTRDDGANFIAARENATSVAAASAAASIASGLRLPEVGPRSAHFAELLQHAAVGALGRHYSDISDQGVKTAGFFVLLGAEMPSVLFETAFISSPWEEKRLASFEYRRRIAVAVAEAVRAYRDGL